MKKFIFPFMVCVILMVGGCSSGLDHNSQPEGTKSSEDIETMQPTHAADENGNENTDDIVLGVDKVLSIIKEAKQSTERAADPKSLNQIGSRLEEEWDTIEKKVEAKFPEDYINIEKSLYPLMAEMQKPMPDLAKVKELSDQTKGKLDRFQIKTGK
ncbi:hypothetical protein [Peribacillus glennii]|uniref:Sporulation protein n=1 Tax=Peribacillus glennii TaxID=2303991 RepID=A0A372LD55_9BACI|nr:hypothetical protein [Peribacillus glennii]RFU63511.1 hypothetical protein D0466_12345 [Peribacillus glennii]